MVVLHIKHAESGDWIGVYNATGHLIYEGHDIEPGVLLTLAGVGYTEEYFVEIPSGRMPETITVTTP